jgi:hypothetical protein
LKTKIKNIVLAISMVLMLFIGSTPMDFFHRFTGHEDTIHNTHSDKGITIENLHIHCVFLSLVVDVFTLQVPLQFHRYLLSEYFNPKPLFSERFVQRSVVASALRGPPASLFA